MIIERGDGMKILVINPNSDTHTDEIMREKARIFTKGNIEIDVKHAAAAPKLVGGAYDAFLGAPEMVEFVEQGDEYDAFIVACHGDPNLDLLKKITDKPVVGIAQASMKIASMIGNTFAVISPSPNSYTNKIALARKYQCQDLYMGSVVSKGNDNDSLLEAAKEAVDTMNVDCIVLGCANYVLADKVIEKEIKRPVLDGLACAIFIAAGMARYKEYKEE